ncbi:fluoride efflux transporter CrcB [Bacillaceae bacterium]
MSESHASWTTILLHALLVGTGGAFGAVARYAVSRWMARRRATLPLGTLTVNLLGSFLLGWLYGNGPGETIALLCGAGFLGAFTTFSTLKWESVQLGRKKQWKILCLYLSATYVGGILFAFLGFVCAALPGLPAR